MSALRGPAQILLMRTANGVFAADAAELNGAVLTATGAYTKNAKLGTVTRSWPMHQVREVRWSEGVPR